MAVQRRNTRQRSLVLDAVRASSSHPTADEIFHAVRERDAHVSRGTVYRNLNLLVEEGAIQQLKCAGGSRFDWRCDRHSHVICPACGAVADVELPYDPTLDRAVHKATGYARVSHYTFFEGLCPACRAKRARTAEGGGSA